MRKDHQRPHSASPGFDHAPATAPPPVTTYASHPDALDGYNPASPVLDADRRDGDDHDDDRITMPAEHV